MAEEEYEILPQQLLSDLKYDVEALKKKLTQPDAKANELILEIESMKDSVHELNEVFQKALEQTKGQDVTQTILNLKDKVEAVVNQNETIAKALITISDKLDEFMHHRREAPKAPVQHRMGPPSMPGPRTAPMPSHPAVGMPTPPGDLPAPPTPPKGKKKGIFA